MQPRKVFVATITNISFILSGVAMYLASLMALPAGIYTSLLGVFSGIHHYFLEKWSRKLDYLGMYFCLGSIIGLGLGVPAFWNIVGTFVFGVGILCFLGVSRKVLGFLIAGCLGVLWYNTGLFQVLHVGAFASIAFVFNFLGDNAHKEFHSIVHGMGWHVVISFVLLLTVMYIIGNMLWLTQRLF